eukprot:m.85678 g.85678  ORF g.85678 m.85678 type:complete len:483 (+) comp15066_c0_seq3:148-1596(+)
MFASMPMPVITTGPPPRRQGWLTKLGFNSGKWQRRWMVLTDSGLVYTAGPNDKGEKGRLFIDSSSRCEFVVPGSEVTANALSPAARLKAPVGEFTFKVTSSWKGSGVRAFYMTADNQPDCDGWMNEITALIQGQPSKRGAAPADPLASAMAMMGAMGMGAGGMGAAPARAAPAPAAHAAPASAGPVPAGGSRPLPAFPGPSMAQKATAPGGNMLDMMKMASTAMATMKAHQQDPHLSAQDNAIMLAQKLQTNTGMEGHDQQLIATLKDLTDNFLPAGMAGFVVTEPPAKGTLGEQYGFQVYDLIFEVEGTPLQPGCSLQEFGNAKANAFAQKGSFSVRVHNFVTGGQRLITILMPPGKPNAVLGIVSSQLPHTDQASAAAAAAGMTGDMSDLYVKGWLKSGAMYISAGQNAYPLMGPLTSENENVYVKVFRSHGSMMVGTGEYHPLYNYHQLSEPLFVEVWRMMGSMMVQSGNKYAPLPMSR